MLPIGFLATGLGGAATGGAGIGATAAAGAAAPALGAMLFNPITIGLAAGMFGLAAFQSMEQNKSLKKQYAAAAQSARNQIDAIDENIQSARRAFYDQTQISGQGARSGLASLQNAQGFASGQSIDAFVAQVMSDQNVDQLARSTQLNDQIKAAQTQKQTISAQARAGMGGGSSPLLAGLSGGLQGFQMGLSLNSAIANFQRVGEINTALSSLAPAASAGNELAISQMQAIQAGVSPALAMMNNSPFTRTFQMQNTILDLQYQGALQQYGASGLRLDSTNNQLRLIQDPLRQYQSWGR